MQPILPNDIIQIVLYYLDIKSLMLFNKINKYYNNLLNNKNFWRGKLNYLQNFSVTIDYTPKNLVEWDKFFNYKDVIISKNNYENKPINWEYEINKISESIFLVDDILIISAYKLNFGYRYDGTMDIFMKDIKEFKYLNIDRALIKNSTVRFLYDNNGYHVYDNNKKYFDKISKDQFTYLFSLIIYSENYIDIRDNNKQSFIEYYVDELKLITFLRKIKRLKEC